MSNQPPVSQPPAPRLSQEYQVLSPPAEEVLPIPVREWSRLAERIRNAAPKRREWGQWVASFLGGVAVSAIVAAVEVASSDGVDRVIWLAVGVSSLVIAIVIVVFAELHESVRTSLQDDVVGDMNALLERYKAR